MTPPSVPESGSGAAVIVVSSSDDSAKKVADAYAAKGFAAFPLSTEGPFSEDKAGQLLEKLANLQQIVQAHGAVSKPGIAAIGADEPSSEFLAKVASLPAYVPTKGYVLLNAPAGLGGDVPVHSVSDAHPDDGIVSFLASL